MKPRTGKRGYWRFSEVSGDVEHFVWFNRLFAKDGKHCFLQSTKLRNVDHFSFTALNNCYARDRKSVWTTGGRFEPEAISSFIVCDDGVKLIEKIQTMSDGTQRPVQLCIPYEYAKDSKAVYYENFAGKIKMLKKADPVAFVSNNGGYFVWDDKHFYIRNKQVSEEEWNQR